MENQTLSCYKFVMSSNKQSKTEVIGVTATLSTKDSVKAIADEDHRSISYVGGALLMRGLAAYERDGSLNEPKDGATTTAKLRIVGRVSAGKPIEAIEVIEEIDVPQWVIDGVRNPRALRVVGDSMVDALVADGDVIIVGDVGEPSGKIVVAEIEGEGVTLKRWRQSAARVTLEPANPDYKPRTISANKVRALAVLVNSIRLYSMPETNEQANAA